MLHGRLQLNVWRQLCKCLHHVCDRHLCELSGRVCVPHLHPVSVRLCLDLHLDHRRVVFRQQLSERHVHNYSVTKRLGNDSCHTYRIIYTVSLVFGYINHVLFSVACEHLYVVGLNPALRHTQRVFHVLCFIPGHTLVVVIVLVVGVIEPLPLILGFNHSV